MAGKNILLQKLKAFPWEIDYTMPESGEVRYQLYFPKLNIAVNKVDFGEGNDRMGIGQSMTL